jgi:sugar-specific transcriptional regulator TrmB
MNDNIVRDMRGLGFSIYEAKVYLEMIKQAEPLTAYEIARIADVPRSKVYEVVEKLFFKQLLVLTSSNPKKYLAVDPDEILRTIQAEFNSTLENVRKEFTNLNSGETADYILNLIGKESIIKKSKEMISGSESSVLIAVGPNMLRELEENLKETEERGVLVNLVYYGIEKINFKNVYYHILNQPDIKNWFNILLDVDFTEGLAGTAMVNSDEGHGIWTKNIYMNNILQDNIIHEIYLGMLEEKLGFEYIQNITGNVPETLWFMAMDKFKDKFRL